MKLKNIVLILITNIIVNNKAIAEENTFNDININKAQQETLNKITNNNNNEQAQKKLDSNLTNSHHLYDGGDENVYEIQDGKIVKIHLNHTILEEPDLFTTNELEKDYTDNEVSFTKIKSFHVIGDNNQKFELSDDAEIVIHYNNTPDIGLILCRHENAGQIGCNQEKTKNRISDELENLNYEEKESQKVLERLNLKTIEIENREKLNYTFTLTSDTPEQIETIIVANTSENKIKSRINFPKNLNSLPNIQVLSALLPESELLELVNTIELNDNIEEILFNKDTSIKELDQDTPKAILNLKKLTKLITASIYSNFIEVIYPDHNISFNNMDRDIYKQIINSKNLHIDYLDTMGLTIDEIQNLLNRHTETKSLDISLAHIDIFTGTKELDLRKNTQLKKFNFMNYKMNKNIEGSIKLKFNTKAQTELAVRHHGEITGELDIRNYDITDTNPMIIEIEDENKEENGLHNAAICPLSIGNTIKNNTNSPCASNK